MFTGARMTGGLSRAIATGLATGAVILCTPVARAQDAPAPPLTRHSATPVTQTAAAIAGRLDGLVTDDRGAPLTGVAITAQGAALQFAVTDDRGRFAFQGLKPGPYLVRAVLPGYSTSRRELVQVLPASPAWQAFRLSRLSTAETVLGEQQVQTAGFPGVTPESSDPADHDHSSVAWRLRPLKRSVLRDEGPQPVDTRDGDGDIDAWLAGQEVDRLGRASSPSSGQSVAVGWLPNLPVSGQVQLLTTSSFDSAQQLFSAANVPAGVAYIALGSQVGSRSNWAAQVAIAQGELSSWALSGNYEVTLASPARAGGQRRLRRPALPGRQPVRVGGRVPRRDRSAGALDVVDHWTLGPTATVTLGTRFSRYGYVDGGPAMWTPSAELRWAPVRRGTRSGHWCRSR